MTSQRYNNGKVLSCQHVNLPFNPYNKFVSVSNILLCTHYGRNGHLKMDCQAKLRAEMSLKN